MKTKEILIELLDLLEKYENDSIAGNVIPDTNGFLSYLKLERFPVVHKVDTIDGGHFNWDESYGERNLQLTDISILVSMMHRYSKMYIKKAFKDSLLRTGDEFSFLITLLTHSSMTKKDAIHTQVMEKTSGIEVLNRLIKLGFVSQYRDEQDKRSVRVRITDLGRKSILEVLPNMKMVSEIVVGNLNDEEINTLANLLRKLDHFHNEIFNHRKDENLEELLQ